METREVDGESFHAACPIDIRKEDEKRGERGYYEMIRDCFVVNKSVALHYLDGNENVDTSLTPLIHIPGAFGSAETFVDDMKQFTPRRCISVSLRGRGKSDVPDQGYTLYDLVSDFDTIVTETEVDVFFLYAFSFAVPTAIFYTSKNPDKIKGLIIGDYPACYPKLSPEWMKKFLAHPDMVSPKAVVATQRESEEIPLWEHLSKITCPVLIMTGGSEYAEPKRILTQEDIRQYCRHLANVSIFTFPNAGHRLWEPDHQLYIDTIKEFLELHDQ